MRRAIAFIVLTLLVGVMACHGKPQRNMRPADVQIYDLPPAEAAWTTKPPEYPKEEGLTAPSKNKEVNSAPKSMGAGAGGGTGIGNGAGGANGGLR